MNNKSFISGSNMNDNFEDADLESSNKVTVYMIKIHSIIIIFSWS